MLQEFLQTGAFAFLLVFARVGAAVMLLPGFGDAFVAPRLRLMIALGLTLVVLPVVGESLPPLPDSPVTLAFLLAGEAMVGIFLGTVARILFAALETAGMVIAYQSGMANAFIADPLVSTQGALFGAFLGALGVVVIFETGLHRLLLSAVVDSYGLFVPGRFPPLDDVALTVARVAAESFDLALRIAAPFLVVSLVFYLGLGLLGRLMPQVQVFFIALPVQIVLGLLVLALTLGAGITWFTGAFEDRIAASFVGG